MIYKVFSVLDAKGGVFDSPWVAQKSEMAIRSFSDAVNDERNPNNMWHRHPEDYALYEIGVFDNDTGLLVQSDAIKCLVTASALRSLVQVPDLGQIIKQDKKEIPG